MPECDHCHRLMHPVETSKGNWYWGDEWDAFYCSDSPTEFHQVDGEAAYS